MPNPVPTLKLQTDIQKPNFNSVDTGRQQMLQAGMNLAQQNLSTAISSWGKQVEYASRIQGVKDATKRDYDPATMPTGNTIAESAYREGATAVFGVRLDSATRQSIQQIGATTQGAAQAGQVADSYIQATADRLPDALKEPYLRSASEERARMVEGKFQQQEKLRLQGIEDQTDLDRVTLTRDVQTGGRPLSDALQRLQASYAAKVANGVTSPQEAMRDFLKDTDDMTVAAAVNYYTQGDIVSRMAELEENADIPVELKNRIANEAFQIGRARRQETEAAKDANDKQRTRDLNAGMNNILLTLRDNNPASPANIDAVTKNYVNQGWNPQLARQRAIDDASVAQNQMLGQMRKMVRDNADQLSPSASQAILNLGQDESNRPLTYDDPSVIYALNKVEREKGYVPPELLNRYLGNGLSYEQEARYRTRSDEKYQALFGSTGWKEAMRQLDVKFPEPTDSLSLGGGIKIQTPRSGGSGADQELIDRRNAITQRLTDVATANPSLVQDPARYKEWQDTVQNVFSTYGQAGTDKYVQDVTAKANQVFGQYGGYDGLKAAYENGRISEKEFRDIYVKNGSILREYESLRKEGKIR